MQLCQFFFTHRFYFIIWGKKLSVILSDKLEEFTGQIRNLPEISGSPASFAISDIIMMHVDINKLHVDIIMWHVDRNKSHVDIIMLHV